MMSTDGTKTALRRRTVLAAAMAAIGLAGAAIARADPDPDLVDLKVVDRETGQELRTWRHHGRLFVAGEPGARYSLRITNHTDGRVLLVMSVDGVNILTGETAKYDQRGYVLTAYGSYDVTGWRKSTTEVAAFTFAALPQSYAALTGRPGDVGIIGMAVFTERPPVQAQVQPLIQVPRFVAPTILPARRDDSSRGDSRAPVTARRAASPPVAGLAVVAPNIPAPPPLFIAPVERARPTPPAPPIVAAPSPPSAESALARPQDEKLGTAHGAREWSVSNITTFERATPYPQSLRQIEYDTYDRLVASGVIPPPPYAEHRPRPFPLNPGGAGFVPDPPGGP